MKRLLLPAVVAEVLVMSSMALASPGDTIWVRRYNGPGNDVDGANDVAVSPDGTKVFVTGTSAGSGFDFATAAYDASTGVTIWGNRYTGPGSYDDYANALAVSPDGTKVFVSGIIARSGTGQDYATVAYDASTGTNIWTKYYNGPGNSDDLANDVAVSPDGTKVYVTGRSAGSTSPNYATVAYDASTGATIWGKRYMGPGNYEDAATAIAVSPDGARVYVTGYSVSDLTTRVYDYATVAYDGSTGAEVWVTRENREFVDAAHALAVSPDGTMVYVTGDISNLAPGPHYYLTLAYDASTGAKIWAKGYKAPGESDRGGEALAVSPDGTVVYVTGTSHYDFATIAYDASTGTELWAQRHGDKYPVESATALAVSPHGTAIYVTGNTSAHSDYLTVAYEASTGAELWTKLYGRGQYEDFAHAIAVSPDGARVFVTGGSTRSATGADYATIAYEA